MIRIEEEEIFGWEAAIRGMRNPKNSWKRSDSYLAYDCGKCGNIELEGYCEPRKHDCSKFLCYHIGDNDMKLMRTLANAGTDHGKFLRMINVMADITAPLYWWKEYDTYKVGTVANSCSTMHKIADKEFTFDDFSIEHLNEDVIEKPFKDIVNCLNFFRELYIQNNDKDDWWQMIQLLPSSYNQKRTVQLNYEVLRHMYFSRKNHKLDEWRTFCGWVESLPYFKELFLYTEGE